MLNGWVVGVLVGLGVAAVGALFLIKRITSRADTQLSIPLPLVKAFRVKRVSTALVILAFGLIFCFGSLYMLYRSYSLSFSDKVGRYTGQAATSSTTYSRSGRTVLAIDSINGQDVKATLHSDSGLYADGPLSGIISGKDPVMTLNGRLTGSTGGFSSRTYTTDVELQCQFPSRDQIECSYTSSPESDTSNSAQNGSMTLTKGST